MIGPLLGAGLALYCILTWLDERERRRRPKLTLIQGGERAA